MSAKENGFTLIEAILYLGILSVIVVFLVSFFQQSVFMRGKINERLDNLDNAQYAMDRLVWYLQNSLKVYEPSSGQISNKLTVDSIVADKNPVTFFVENNILKMQLGQDPALALTNSKIEVESLNFSNQSFSNQPAMVQITLTVKGNSFWQVQPLTLVTSAKLEK